MLTSINEFVNSFEYEFLFENKKIEDIYDKHYKDIPDNEFRSLIAIDPTSIIKGEEETPSFDNIKKIGQYSKWLFKLYATKQLKFEDLYKAKEYLELFDNLKKKNVLDRDDVQKDINKYKNLPELFMAIEEYMEEDADVYSKGDTERRIKNEESTKVFENDNWLVVIPKTHDAACYYGKNTQWCTASKDDDGYFNQYTDEGPLYVNINKNKNEKFQFHFPSGQFMDETDAEIGLGHLLTNNADLKEYYEKEFNENIVGDIIIKNLPDGVGYNDDENGRYILANEWSSFSELFSDEKEDVKSILSGDGREYFESYETMKYSGYDDIDDDTLNSLLSYIENKISEEGIELEEEFDKKKLTSLKKLYNFCKDEGDELEFVWDSIDLAYTSAQESADESEAYDKITDSIIRHFNIDIDDIKWDEETSGYKMGIKGGNVYTLDQYIEAYDNGDIEDGESFKIKYGSPPNGYDGDVDENHFAEEITNQMDSW